MRLFILAIDFYQACLRPALPRCCRFSPSCSDFARQALELHGIHGLALTARRLLRCHPFHSGGFDPVPFKNHG